MNVEINNVKKYDEEKAVINVVEMTEDLQTAIAILKENSTMIPVIKNLETFLCRTDKIYYIESVDKHVYVYTKDDCYEAKYRLYELEDILNKNFLRCSKSMMINIRKINSVKAEINGRMIAKLLNDENIIIARKYVKNLKERLGI